MIFEAPYDDKYQRWFAWRPVALYGPDEWDRCKRLNTRPRIAWLEYVWRYDCQPRPYYALPDEETRNNLLLESIEQ
jgi:hypothetical protein